MDSDFSRVSSSLPTRIDVALSFIAIQDALSSLLKEISSSESPSLRCMHQVRKLSKELSIDATQLDRQLKKNLTKINMLLMVKKVVNAASKKSLSAPPNTMYL